MDQAGAIDAFAALAQPTRLDAFRLLVRVGPEGLPALEISRQLGTKPSTLSGHLSILKRAGVLTATRYQREIHYSANLGSVNALIQFLIADCCGGQLENCPEIITLPNLCLRSTIQNSNRSDRLLILSGTWTSRYVNVEMPRTEFSWLNPTDYILSGMRFQTVRKVRSKPMRVRTVGCANQHSRPIAAVRTR